MRIACLKSTLLANQIRDAERRVSNRQRSVGVHAATLARQVRQQMTAPASLLLAGGVGFILGELTRCQAPAQGGTAQPHAAAATPVRTTLTLITTAHTLYMALPLAWRTKVFSGTHGNVEQSSSAESGSHVCGEERRAPAGR